ncbi:unnamed protein product [Pleuronectes platessa]|uniref:Uncharacterized protein n=1 Tax=Pleuronectes platessa TaxID=8262 RepID=A0A9N7Y992_PLEPL|nr:unnamed protein product [Pleuronectes platessa]
MDSSATERPDEPERLLASGRVLREMTANKDATIFELITASEKYFSDFEYLMLDNRATNTVSSSFPRLRRRSWDQEAELGPGGGAVTRRRSCDQEAELRPGGGAAGDRSSSSSSPQGRSLSSVVECFSTSPVVGRVYVTDVCVRAEPARR